MSEIHQKFFAEFEGHLFMSVPETLPETPETQAAELLNLGTGAAVSAQLSKLAQATAASRKLRRQIAGIEEAIDKEIG